MERSLGVGGAINSMGVTAVVQGVVGIGKLKVRTSVGTLNDYDDDDDYDDKQS